MLQSAFDSERPTILLYPKTCLNDPARTAAIDPAVERATIGAARPVRQGTDLSIVSWGSTMPIAEQAAERLAAAGISADVLDLRSITPWDHEAVAASARKTGRLLIVHEDGRTCGFGAEIAATIAESLGPAARIRRVTRDDTFVSCNIANHLDTLPSLQSIVENAAALLETNLSWEKTAATKDIRRQSLIDIEARGSSPADHTVTVVSWLVNVGDDVRAGQSIAELEAEKALYTLASPADGRLHAKWVNEGQTVPTSTVIGQIEGQSCVAARRTSAIDPGTPRLTARPRAAAEPATSQHRRNNRKGLSLLSICGTTGAERVENQSLIANYAGRTADEIQKRTGIIARHRLARGQSLLDLAERVSLDALASANVRFAELSSIILSTTTPEVITPSMACMLSHRLATRLGEIPAAEPAAYDILAACTGYLYALRQAHDLCLAEPTARVLVVTAEAMTRTTDPNDFDTSILFGDAVTATVVAGPEADLLGSPPLGILRRPIVSAHGEPGKIINVPIPGSAHFRMDGLRVYSEAMKRMSKMLKAACDETGIAPADLSLIIPHQANGRIVDAITAQLGVAADRVVNAIAETGNTSSSSIPLVLAKLVASGKLPSGTIGLTAFGGGFTFGAALLDIE
jgi:2-oxoisovalerate dehydrogenase E1 component